MGASFIYLVILDGLQLRPEGAGLSAGNFGLNVSRQFGITLGRQNEYGSPITLR